MELYFMRHGIAADRGDPDFPDDRERPLTGEGKKKVRGISSGMKSLGLSFDLIFTSPYPRASETAAIVAKVFGMQKSAQPLPLLQAEASIKPLIEFLRKQEEK